MPSPATHHHPLRRRVRAGVAVAVAVQAFALALASPWLHPAWAAALALALGAAALPSLRDPSVARTLALRLALDLAALGAAALAIGVMIRTRWTATAYPGASPALHAVAAACWLWAAHAPLSMSRWWVDTRPSRDAALEVAEPLGLSLLAAAVALTLRNDERAWSTGLGTAWGTGLCAALGAAVLGWAWVAQWRRRAWMRRVADDRDPAWRLVGADGATTAEPWSHAAADEGASALAPRGAGAHYREAAETEPVARVGRREGAAWWGRRALHLTAGLWGLALLHWGASTLLCVAPPDHRAEILASIRALHVRLDPCTARDPHLHARSREFRLEGERVEVWVSGYVAGWRAGGRRREILGGPDWQRCVGEAAARRWLDAARDDAATARDAVEALRVAPEELEPADATDGRCTDGRWTRVDWLTPGASDPMIGDAMRGCWLEASGRWECDRGRRRTYGRVVGREACALIADLQRYAGEVDRVPPSPPRGAATVCGSRRQHPIPRALDALGDALADRLRDRSGR